MLFEDEKEMEDIVFQAMRDGRCLCTGEIYSHVFRQFEIKGYGVIDILCLSLAKSCTTINVDIHIYELKNANINHQAIMQIARYKQGVERYIKNQFVTTAKRKQAANVNIYGHILGLGYASQEDICFLVDSIPWLDCFFCAITKDGVFFKKSSGWYNKAEDFSWKNKRINHITRYIPATYKNVLKAIKNAREVQL